MKNMKSIALIIILIATMNSTILANADNSETKEKRNTMVEMKKEIIKNKNEKIAERKEERKSFMKTQKEKREEGKENIKAFRENIGTAKEVFSNLSDEDKEKIEEIRDEHEKAVEEIRDQLKNNDLTIEEREELEEELKQINDKNIEKLKEIFGENIEIMDWIKAREELKETNQLLRNEAKEARIQYRENRVQQIEIQKEFYLNKLAINIPKVSITALERISKKAQDMVDRVEKNTKISDEKKDELISKIVALIEILEEEIDNREATLENIDLNSILEDEDEDED